MESLDFDKPPTPPLPVEIARLVYTFLGNTKCYETRDKYQTEHPELNELQKLVERNILRDIEFKLQGKDLEHILKEYILMLHGINKIAVKYLPGKESLSSLGPILKLKRLSDELAKLQSTNKVHEKPPSRNFYLKRRKVEVVNSQGLDEIKRKYKILDPKVHQGVICPSKPLLTSVVGGCKEDCNMGGVIPDLLKLQPVPRAELNELQRLPSSDREEEDHSSSFEQDALISTSDNNTWTVKEPISHKSSCDATEKSRRNAFKANPPKKKSSLPEVAMDGEQHVKKKLQKLSQDSNEELLTQLVAEPLVSILSTTQNIDETVESFMSNQEYLDSLNNLLADLYDAPETETITLHRSAEETRRKQKSGDGEKKSKVVQKQEVQSSSRFTANFRRSFEAVKHTDHFEIEIVDHVENFDKKPTLTLVADLTLADVKIPKKTSPIKMAIQQLMQDSSCNDAFIHSEERVMGKNLSTPTKTRSRYGTPIKMNSSSIKFSSDARPTTLNEKSDTVRFVLKTPEKQTSVTGFENILTLPTVTYNSPKKSLPDQEILETSTAGPRGEKRVFTQDTQIKENIKVPRLEVKSPRTPIKLVESVAGPSAKTADEAFVQTTLKTPTKSRHFPNILRPKLTPRKGAFEADIFRTPVKPPSSEFLTTPQKIDLECSETLECNTPPGETFHLKHWSSSVQRNKSPTKISDRANEAQAESTPLKALREAVRLATPSPIKYLFTPQKLLASKSHNTAYSPAFSDASVTKLQPRHFQTLFTPSPSSRGTISPATSKKQTPLKGLAEALSKLSESGSGPKKKQASPTKTSLDVAKKLFTEDNQVLLQREDQESPICQSDLQLQGNANWSSPDALRAHSTPRIVTKPPTDCRKARPEASPKSLRPPSSSCGSIPTGLPDFPLDLTLKSISGDNISPPSTKAQTNASHSISTAGKPGNVETPNKSRTIRSVVMIDPIPPVKTLKILSPKSSVVAQPSIRKSKKSNRQSKSARETKKDSDRKRGRDSKKKLQRVATAPIELVNIHGLTLDKMNIYFSQPPKKRPLKK